MSNLDTTWIEEEAKEHMPDARNREVRLGWREDAVRGMISCVGEYTPVEFISLIDYVEELEAKIEKLESKNDE